MLGLSDLKISLLSTGSSLGGASPALALNFLYGGLDSRITFSRGTNATLVDSTGKITYAPANLVLQSQTFDNAAWTKTAATVTTDATTAPDGTTTADRIVPSTASVTNHRVQISPSYSAATYSVSVYAKADGYNWLKIRVGAAYANFNVSSGVTGLIGGTTISSNISSAGNGWYRCNLIVSSTGGDVIYFYVATTNNAGLDTDAYAGDGTSGIFIWGAQLEPVTYQTTPSTYVATTSAAYYGPRFDYDPVTLAAKGLLIEGQRTNILLYSEQFNNVAWTLTTGTLTSGISDPAGGTNAFTLTATAGNASIQQAQLGTAGSTYTTSFWIKRRTGTGQVSLRCGDVTNIPITVTSSWARYSVTAVASTTILRAAVALAVSGDAVDIYGAQLEAGAFATSYIPTVASTVTRNADIATMTGTNFSSWYNASEGSFVASYEASPNTFTTYLAASNGVVAQNSMHMDNDGAGNMRVAYYSGSSAVALLTLGAVGTINAVNNIATAYKVNDFAASRNGGAVVTDTAGAVPVGVNRLNIGADPSGAAAYVTNTHIRSIQYYNTRLSDAQLQALTAPSMLTTLSLDFTNGVYEG